MNRPHLVESALQNWIACRGIDEIILVDWSSQPSIVMPGSVNDERIKSLRVNGERYWQLSPAYNFAALQATGDVLIKMDVDYRIEPDFLERTKIRDGQFRCGEWRLGRNDNEKYLSGFLMAWTKDFWAAGGYNENIKVYGHDDIELYARLAQHGLERLPVTGYNGILHVEHDNKLRRINQEEGVTNGSVPPEFTPMQSVWAWHEDGWSRSVDEKLGQ